MPYKYAKLLIFALNVESMSEEIKQEVFEHSEDHPLEELGFEKIPRRGNFPTVVDLLVMVVLIVASQFLASLFGVWLGLPMPDMLSGEIIDIEQFIGTQVERGESFAVIYPLSMMLAALSVYGYIRLRDGKGKIARSSTKGFSPNIILFGLIWLIAVQIVVEPLSVLLPQAEQNSGQGFWAIVTAVVFAPVFEEFIFRGLILESLLRRHRRLFSVIVSSIVFALVHFQPSVMFTAFVSGLVLGTIYLHTNSIFSTIILHSINNAIAYSLITLNIEDYSYYEVLGGGELYFIVYGISFVVCVIAIVETWRRRKRSVLPVK